MNAKHIFMALLMATSSYGHEKVINNFNGSEQTVASMTKVIQKEASDGATLVTFPGGRWKWHDLTQLNLPAVVKVERKTFFEMNKEFESSVKLWVKDKDIKAVQIRVNPKLVADVFFRVERCISKLGIPYSVTNSDEEMKEAVWLMKTDGKVMLVPQPKNGVQIPDFSEPDFSWEN